MAEQTTAANTVTSYSNIASGLASVVNAYTVGKMTSNLFKHNAAMAGFERFWVDKKIDQQIDILYDDEARLLGSNRASQGGSGFSIASETNKEIERDIFTNIEKTASVIRSEGGLDKLRISSKVSELESKASSAQAAGNINAATALTRTIRSKGASNIFKSTKKV
jgi:hypothetical protein